MGATEKRSNKTKLKILRENSIISNTENYYYFLPIPK